MMSFFGKNPNANENMRQQKRQLNKTQRELTRDRNALDRQEKQLEAEIKKAAKMGNKQAATVLAKQLVALRKQKNKNLAINSKITAIGYQAQSMHSSAKMAGAMATTSKTMASVNATVNPQGLQKTLRNFEMESAKMDMSEEMINDTLDDIMNESGDEEEQEAIVTQVLDEIGIDISGKMAEAPTAPGKLPSGKQAAKAGTSDADIEEMLAKLKA